MSFGFLNNKNINLPLNKQFSWSNFFDFDFILKFGIAINLFMFLTLRPAKKSNPFLSHFIAYVTVTTNAVTWFSFSRAVKTL